MPISIGYGACRRPTHVPGNNEATALLRTVFGEERAEVVAAAFIAETPASPESPEGPEEDETEEIPERERPLQPDLF